MPGLKKTLELTCGMQTDRIQPTCGDATPPLSGRALSGISQWLLLMFT